MASASRSVRVPPVPLTISTSSSLSSCWLAVFEKPLGSICVASFLKSCPSFLLFSVWGSYWSMSLRLSEKAQLSLLKSEEFASSIGYGFSAKLGWLEFLAKKGNCALSDVYCTVLSRLIFGFLLSWSLTLASLIGWRGLEILNLLSGELEDRIAFSLWSFKTSGENLRVDPLRRIFWPKGEGE